MIEKKEIFFEKIQIDSLFFLTTCFVKLEPNRFVFLISEIAISEIKKTKIKIEKRKRRIDYLLFLTICFVKLESNHFKWDHQFGFEAIAWYWLLVDVVCLYSQMLLSFWVFVITVTCHLIVTFALALVNFIGINLICLGEHNVNILCHCC